MLGTAAQLTLACLVALLPLRLPGHPRAFRWVLLGALLLLTLGGVAERELSRSSWQTSDKAGLWSSWQSRDTLSTYGFRLWQAPGLERATVSLEVRLLEGQPGWDWYRSSGRFSLVPHESRAGDFTRVTFPEHVPGEGQPYLMRTFDTRDSLENRIFRVLLELRRVPDAGTPEPALPKLTTRQALPLQRGEPTGGRDCTGVSLQAWNARGGGRCLPLTLTDDWQRYSLSWRVPDEIDPQAQVVRVLLQGFGDETLDVRRVRLYRGRAALGPLQPQGGALQVAWGAQPESHAGFSFVPTSQWQTLTLPADKGPKPAPTLSVALSAGGGLRLQTRNVVVRAPDGEALAEAVSSPRQTLFFSDPNLAGHTLATLGLAFISLASPLWGALGAALSALNMLLTGSRAALAGLMIGILWLAWSWLPRNRRAGLALFVLALGGGALLLAQVWGPLESLRLLSLSEITSRSDIWETAWRAFLSQPWQGLGAGGFRAYWAGSHGGEAVQHAHNYWLEAAASYGVLGLISALALGLGLLALAFRWGGARAAGLVIGVLVMNLFDTTLSYAGVLLTLMLALATFKPPLLQGQTVSEQNAHNTGVASSRISQAPHK